MSSADVLAVLGGEESKPETAGSVVETATAYELRRIDAGAGVDADLLDVIGMIAEIMKGMKEGSE